MHPQAIQIDYTNWRGVRSVRTIVPLRMVFEASEWHGPAQWLVEAYDAGDIAKTPKQFAMTGVHSWEAVA